MPFQTAITIAPADFDLSAEVAALRACDAHVGAVCSFVGTVRAQDPQNAPDAKNIAALELEHYPGMTEKSIMTMVEEARQRFDIRNVRIIHRIGRLDVGAQIVLVVTAASHRRAAFQSCEFLMDYLKTQAPFWKKTVHDDGSTHWVDARVTDDAAAQRWGLDAPANASCGNAPQTP